MNRTSESFAFAIVVPGESPLRKGLFESAGASAAVIVDEIIVDALVGKLTAQLETTT